MWSEPLKILRIGYISVFGPWLYVMYRDWHVLVASSRTNIASEFFPLFFTNSGLFLIAGLGVPTGLALALCIPATKTSRICLVAAVFGSAYLVVTPRTIGYQLFVSSFWVTLWLLWYLLQTHQLSNETRRSGQILAGLILTLVFGSAAIGKLTGGYWDGLALYHLFFLYQHDIKFQILREILDPEGLKTIAVLYSRITVVAEASMALVPWLLPPRWSFSFWIVGLLGMWIITTVRIVEAIGPLLGLAVIGLLLTNEQTTTTKNSSQT